MNRNKETFCPVCHSTDCRTVIDIPQIPVHCNRLWPSREEALGAPRGNLELAFCPVCTHLFNRAFDPDLMDYSQGYTNPLECSPRFKAYIEKQAERLIHDHRLYGKTIVEIGCGEGYFLRLLCDLGNNRGIGFDPSSGESSFAGSEGEGKVRIVPDYYSEADGAYEAAMICCRHVLEHLPTPGSLLETVRRSLDGRPGCILFFEVPNAMYTVKDMGIWDLIYEHCSYFTIDSLAYLFGSYGFGVQRLTEEFEGQFLGIDGVTGTDPPSPAVPPDTVQAEGSDIERYVSAFAKNYAAKIVDMETLLERNRPHSHRTVIWGAGSKGVTFSNLYNLKDDIPYIVDINEQKQGTYVPGTGQRVVGPAFLQEFRPETVLVMNPAYLQEIQGICHDLSVSPELIAV